MDQANSPHLQFLGILRNRSFVSTIFRWSFLQTQREFVKKFQHRTHLGGVSNFDAALMRWLVRWNPRARWAPREDSVDLFWIGLVLVMFALFAGMVGLCGRLK